MNETVTVILAPDEARLINLFRAAKAWDNSHVRAHTHVRTDVANATFAVGNGNSIDTEGDLPVDKIARKILKIDAALRQLPVRAQFAHNWEAADGRRLFAEEVL